MDEVRPAKIIKTPPSDTYPAEQWQPGDVVLDAAGYLYMRARPDDIARGWAWGYVPERITAGTDGANGSVEDGDPKRPLHLLIRDGRPITIMQASAQKPQSLSSPHPNL